MTNTKFKHLKTGNIYYMLSSVINATNGIDGQYMVLYKNEEGSLFVRESVEFHNKFKVVEDGR